MKLVNRKLIPFLFEFQPCPMGMSRARLLGGMSTNCLGKSKWCQDVFRIFVVDQLRNCIFITLKLNDWYFIICT